MAKYKIVIDDTLAGFPLDLEQEVLTRGGYDDFYLELVKGDKEDILKAAEDAEAICAWLYFDEAEYKRLAKCEVIVSPGIGVDRINLENATKAGICVANIPDYCIEEVAVHSVALLLDCNRRITFFDKSVKAGNWDETMPGEIFRMVGRTFGLMSFGHIPQRISELLKPFGMRIIAYDPFAPDSIFIEKGVERVNSIDELFKESNYVSVHTPYMPSTHHIIGKAQFDLMKDHSIIVIAGRGGVVDEDDLKVALDSGKISCAGLDVIEDELTYKSVLKNMDNVVISPHVASCSEEADKDIRQKVMEQIIAVVREKQYPKNLVNKSVCGSARFEKKA